MVPMTRVNHRNEGIQFLAEVMVHWSDALKDVCELLSGISGMELRTSRVERQAYYIERQKRVK